MRGKKITTSVTLIFFFLVLHLPAEENLVKNFSFEQTGAKDSSPDNWFFTPRFVDPYESDTKDHTGQGKGAISASAFYRGQKSVLIESEDIALSSWRQNNIHVKPGSTYRFSVWVRTEGVKGDGGSRIVGACFFYFDKGERLLLDIIMPGTRPWTCWRKIIFAPETATKIDIELCLYCSQGKIWFDEVSLIEMKE